MGTLFLSVCFAVPAYAQDRTVLRVCADPNNLPFSNEAEEGFENRLAEIVARELKLPVEYTWFPQRRGFTRNTLRAKPGSRREGSASISDPLSEI